MNSSSAVLIAAAIAISALVLSAWLWRRLVHTERERRNTAAELNRRLSELFSLQELAYVLSDSLQLDRIVEQVVRYAMRFLDARGALVALTAGEQGGPLRVTAAEGSLTELLDRTIEREDGGLLARSVTRDRLELVRPPGGGPVVIAQDATANTAAAVPLRAHGVVVGTLVIAEPRAGALESEDIRLLSTVATHAAVVLANARFFSMVQRAKEQWETACDALREGFAVVDASGRVQRANRALAELLGQSVPQVLGTDLSQAIFEQPEMLRQRLLETQRGESRPPLLARSEKLGRILRIDSAPIPSAPDERSVVVLVEDVTDQQMLESQLIQSEKLAAVGQLVSGVAHELNNPLTSIAGLSELLLEQSGIAPKDREHLQVIHEQAERAGRIVRNLLTFARKGPADATRVDVREVIRRTLLLLGYDFRMRNIEIEKVLEAEVPDVLGDRAALQQVVLNLLTNAAQAVAATPDGTPRRIAVRVWFDETVHMRIADSGPGIPDDVASHIFTPFFTTKEPGQGTGLGLSIAYSIVEAHGGHIALERASEGTAFRVDLPPAPADAPIGLPRGDQQPAKAPGTATPRRILLVDDDPAVGRLVRAFFGREGHTVEIARTATHALELAGGGGGWDLVIADGRAATRERLFVEELLERHPALRERTLVATGDVRPGTEETMARLGVRYLRKPFNLRLLRDEAARVWAPAALL